MPKRQDRGPAALFSLFFILSKRSGGKSQKELAEVIQRQTDETVQKLVFDEFVPGHEDIRNIKRYCPEKNQRPAGSRKGGFPEYRPGRGGHHRYHKDINENGAEHGP